MGKILVIDDEVEVVNLLKDFISPRGHNVTTALNGEEGLRKFYSDNPDLVICDLKMPRIDGFEVLKRLRSGNRWVPVIILTALTDPGNTMKGYALEADYYVTKPVDLDSILKAVQLMLSLIPLRKTQSA